MGKIDFSGFGEGGGLRGDLGAPWRLTDPAEGVDSSPIDQ